MTSIPPSVPLPCRSLIPFAVEHNLSAINYPQKPKLLKRRELEADVGTVQRSGRVGGDEVNVTSAQKDRGLLDPPPKHTNTL